MRSDGIKWSYVRRYLEGSAWTPLTKPPPHFLKIEASSGRAVSLANWWSRPGRPKEDTLIIGDDDASDVGIDTAIRLIASCEGAMEEDVVRKILRANTKEPHEH